MRLVDLDTKVTTWNYDFYKQEYVAVQTTVGEMIDLNTHEGLSIPIVEIPEPHGRMIDADALADSFEPSDFWNPDAEDNCFAAVRIVHSASTIIPASEG